MKATIQEDTVRCVLTSLTAESDEQRINSLALKISATRIHYYKLVRQNPQGTVLSLEHSAPQKHEVIAQSASDCGFAMSIGSAASFAAASAL